MSNEKFKGLKCPMEATLMVIGGKYKIKIIFYLMTQPLRYSELQKWIPQASQKMLTQQLKELEADGIISRKAFQEARPRTEYSLTEKGKSLRPIILELYHWGELIFQENDIPNLCELDQLEQIINNNFNNTP